MIRARILAIGDELVRGACLDTNSQKIARALEDSGIDVVGHQIVSDDPAELGAAAGHACRHAELLISTGGLGPTEDDRTREVAAELAGVALKEHESTRKRLERWAAERNRVLSPSNMRQILMPEGAMPLSNPIGTAPGFALEVTGCTWFAMPGVPTEMARMLESKVLPAIRRRYPDLGAVATRNLLVAGLPESVLGEKLAPFMVVGREPRVGVTAGAGLMKVRVVARGADEAAAAKIAEADVDAMVPILAGHWLATVDGRADPDLSALVVEEATGAGVTVALAESCTGGLVSALLTANPGASAALACGFVTYTNEAKTRDLNVPADVLAEHGAVSEPVAEAMARGALARSGATFAGAISGIAGPGGGSEEKPVGTVCFGLAEEGGSARSWRRDYGEMPRVWLQERSAWEILSQLLLAVRRRGRVEP